MSIPHEMSSGRGQPAYKNPEFRARLQRLIGAEAPYAWAERIGISKGAFTRIWREGTVPTSELLFRIRKATGISLDWLLAGDQPPGAAPGGASPDLTYIGEYVAQEGGAPARRRGARRNPRRIALNRDCLPQLQDADPTRLAYLIVKGDSMAPTLGDGDLALMDRRAERPEQEGIYVLRQGVTHRVRRVQKLSGERYQALADNPRYQPFTFRLSQQLAVIGRVVWAGRRI